jgi:DNA invertase Pin-like site-specific DNA recombinase
MNPKSNTPLRLDGIVRVSKTGDRDTLRSPEQQEKDIRRWAKERGHEIVHVHVAIDQTGRKRTGHPAIEAAKERALAGVVDGIAAAYVSRFTRNTLYGLTTVAELLDAGKYFFAPECPFDLRTPEGRKYLTGLLAEAEYEGDVKARHFARGVEESIEDGVHLGEPYGYRKSNGKASKLAVVEAEAKQVRKAHRLRAEGFSWAAIADALNASGAAPRPYKRDGQIMQAVWTHATARQLVVGKGPQGEWSVYLGMAFNGEHVTEGAHPAIVEPELFQAANDTRGTKFAGAGGPGAEHLLKGLVRCRGCGYAMTYSGADYLRCRSAQHGAGYCPEPAACPARPLEELVWARFEEEWLGEGRSEPVSDNGRVAAARDGLAAAVRRLRKAQSLFTMAETPREEREADAELKAAKAQLRDAETEEAEARAAARGSRLPARLTVEEARNAPIPDRRHWLSLVYAAVIVRKARVWRERVADRFAVVAADEAPGDGTRLRGLVAA